MIRDIRRIYDIYDILGLDRHKSKIVCPLPGHSHANNTASFHIFDGDDGVQRFQCFGNCGKRGDVVDLVGYLNVIGYDPARRDDVIDAIAALSEHEPPQEPRKIVRKPKLNQGLWRECLPPSERALAYAERRGLSRETLDKFQVGSHGKFMAIPCFENKELRAIKYRNTGLGIRFWSEPGSVCSLFNREAVELTDDPVLVLKGEIPVMLLDQYGFRAVCLTSGEGADITPWKHLFAFCKRVVVVGDNDTDPVVRARMQGYAAEKAAILRAELRFPPVTHKDVDGWILDDPSAIATIKGWLLDRSAG